MEEERDVRSKITNTQERSLAAKDLELKNLTADIAKGNSQVRALDNELMKVKSFLREAYSTLKNEKTEKECAQAAEQKCQTMLQEEKSARLMAEATIGRLQSKYQELKSSNTHRLEDAAQEDLRESKDQLEKLSFMKDGLQDQIKKLSKVMSDLRDDNTNLKEQIEDLEGDLETVFSESKRDRTAFRLQFEELAKYQQSSSIEESIRTTWRKAYGEELDPEDSEDGQESSSDAKPANATMPTSGSKTASIMPSNTATAAISTEEPTSITEAVNTTEVIVDDEMDQLSEPSSGQTSPVFGATGGSGDRLGIGPLTLPIATRLRERYQKQQQDLEMILDISPVRAKAILQTLRKNTGYQHNHPGRLVIIASELLRIPRKFITTLHKSLENVDHEKHLDSELGQKIAAKFLGQESEVLDAMLKRQPDSNCILKDRSSQTKAVETNAQASQTDDMMTATRDTEAGHTAMVSQASQTEDVTVGTQTLEAEIMAIRTEGIRTIEMATATQDTETDHFTTVTKGTQTEDTKNVSKTGGSTDNPADEEHSVSIRSRSNLLSLSGIQEISMAPSVITIATPIFYGRPTAFLSVISRVISQALDVLRKTSGLTLLYIAVFLLVCMLAGLMNEQGPVQIMDEDLWIKSVTSTRTGGGCGFSVPGWLWEDPLLELSGSLFG